MILGLVLIVFFLQSNWMRQVTEKEATDIVPKGFAEGINRLMLRAKGLSTEQDAIPVSADGWGNAEKIDCKVCLGSGQALSVSGEKEICPICLGVGFHLIRRFELSDRICTFCVGMGRAELPDIGKVGNCPRCDGRGLICKQAADAAPDGN